MGCLLVCKHIFRLNKITMKKCWNPCDSDPPLEDYVILTIPDCQRHPLRHTNPDVVYSALLHDRTISASYGLQMGVKL